MLNPPPRDQLAMFLFGLKDTLNRPGKLFYQERTGLYIESFYNDYNPQNNDSNDNERLDRRGVRRNVFNVYANVVVTNQRVDGEDKTLEPMMSTPGPSPGTEKPTAIDSNETMEPTSDSRSLEPTTVTEDFSLQPTTRGPITIAPMVVDDTLYPTLGNNISSRPSLTTDPPTVSENVPAPSLVPTVNLSGAQATSNMTTSKKSDEKHGPTQKVKMLGHRNLNEYNFTSDLLNVDAGSQSRFNERPSYQRSLQFTARDCTGVFLAVQLTIELSYQLRGVNIDLDDIIAEPFRREEYRRIYIDDFLMNQDFGNVGPFKDLTCTSPILFPGDLETDIPTYSPTFITDNPTSKQPTLAPTIITEVPTESPSLVSPGTLLTFFMIHAIQIILICLFCIFLTDANGNTNFRDNNAVSISNNCTHGRSNIFVRSNE